jgi:hypothetical protein
VYPVSSRSGCSNFGSPSSTGYCRRRTRASSAFGRPSAGRVGFSHRPKHEWVRCQSLGLGLSAIWHRFQPLEDHLDRVGFFLARGGRHTTDPSNRCLLASLSSCIIGLRLMLWRTGFSADLLGRQVRTEPRRRLGNMLKVKMYIHACHASTLRS